MINLDFFNIFTQQAQRNRISLPKEAPQIEGTDPNKPAFEFSGQGRHYSDENIARMLRNITCQTNELTIYASVLFKGNDMGGPIVTLSHNSPMPVTPPILGLFVEQAASQLILMYSHQSMARVEKFNQRIPRGRCARNHSHSVPSNCQGCN